MNYSYLWDNRFDKEGFYRATQQVIAYLGPEKFDRLYYKSKVSQVELWYLANLLIDIFKELFSEDLKKLIADQDLGKGPLAKLYTKHKAGIN